ncbi:MAG: LemA family protein [Bacilli bacterium]
MPVVLMIILTILIVCSLIGIVFIVIFNKYQLIKLKIDEALNNIDLLLQKKLDFISKAIPLVKEHSKEDTGELQKVLLLKTKKLNNFQLDEQLVKAKHDFQELLDIYPVLEKKKSLAKLEFGLEDTEEDLEAAKDYYNDNVKLYNKLVACFPSNIVGFIFHYKKKELFANKQEEMFEILKK